MLTAIFKESMNTMGKWNKNENKAGIRPKIDVRVMHLAVIYANAMGQRCYETFIENNPAYPTYSTIKKLLAKVNIIHDNDNNNNNNNNL